MKNLGWRAAAGLVSISSVATGQLFPQSLPDGCYLTTTVIYDAGAMSFISMTGPPSLSGTQSDPSVQPSNGPGGSSGAISEPTIETSLATAFLGSMSLVPTDSPGNTVPAPSATQSIPGGNPGSIASVSFTAVSAVTSAAPSPSLEAGDPLYIIVDTGNSKSKRAILYVAFDETGSAILVDNKNRAAVFVIDKEGNLLSGGKYVGTSSSGGTVALQQFTDPPPTPYNWEISGGTISLDLGAGAGNATFCTTPGGDFYVVYDNQPALGCSTVDIAAASGPEAVATTTTSAAATEAASTTATIAKTTIAPSLVPTPAVSLPPATSIVTTRGGLVPSSDPVRSPPVLSTTTALPGASSISSSQAHSSAVPPVSLPAPSPPSSSTMLATASPDPFPPPSSARVSASSSISYSSSSYAVPSASRLTSAPLPSSAVLQPSSSASPSQSFSTVPQLSQISPSPPIPSALQESWSSAPAVSSSMVLQASPRTSASKPSSLASSPQASLAVSSVSSSAPLPPPSFVVLPVYSASSATSVPVPVPTFSVSQALTPGVQQNPSSPISPPSSPPPNPGSSSTSSRAPTMPPAASTQPTSSTIALSSAPSAPPTPSTRSSSTSAVPAVATSSATVPIPVSTGPAATTIRTSTLLATTTTNVPSTIAAATTPVASSAATTTIPAAGTSTVAPAALSSVTTSAAVIFTTTAAVPTTAVPSTTTVPTTTRNPTTTGLRAATTCTVGTRTIRVPAQTLSPLRGKRGLPYANTSALAYYKQPTQISWAYNYARLPNATNNPGVFPPPGLPLAYYPLLYNAKVTLDSWINEASNSIELYGSDALFSFNEPDLCANLQTSACMSVKEALDAWAIYMEPFAKCGVRLIAPSVGNDGRYSIQWLTQFMGNATSPQYNYTIDAINVHWYASPYNFIYFKEYMTLAHSIAPDKPLWVTEYGFDKVYFDENLNIEFLKNTTGWVDAQPWIEKVAWFGYYKNNLLDANATGLNLRGQVYGDYKAS